MSMAKKPDKFIPLNIAVLTVSDTRTRENDTSGDLIQERLEAAGHRVVDRRLEPDDMTRLRASFQSWIADPGIDVIIATGGTGLAQRDVTPDAVRDLFTRPIPGFGELFRMLSFDDVGTSTLMSRAEAGFAGQTLIFLLPGSTGACRLAMDRIILEQLDTRHRPCSLAELLPSALHD